MVSTTDKQRIVVVAQDAAAFDAVAKKLRGLGAFGHRVVLVWLTGEPSQRLSAFKARVPVRPWATRPVRARARHATSTSPLRVLKARDALMSRLTRDPVALRALDGADAVVPVGPEAWAVVDQLVGPRRPLVTAQELDAWEQLGSVWRKLQRHVDSGPPKLDAGYAKKLLEHIAVLGGQVPPVHQRLLLPLVESLHSTGEYDLALQLVEHLDPEAEGVDQVETALRRGWRVVVQTSASGEESPELREVAGEVIRAADTALARDDIDRAVVLTTLALRLLFHRELHADGLSSPLVEDPDRFLADWRASRIGQLLLTPTPRRPVLHRVRDRGANARGRLPGTDRPHVVVVPGSYPQFAGPVIDALGEEADLDVIDLAARPGMRGLGVRPELVGARLREALGDEGVPDYELLEELERADALFVDWADKGAVAAIMSAPEGLPVTLRVHSMDALSAWIHLIDWSRVSDLVLVSEHLRSVVVRLLGDRLDGTRLHVVPVVLDASRLPIHKTDGHRRRLLMIGWAQRVKDPLWALDTLAALRRVDPKWTLTLIGADFVHGAVRSQAAYMRAFWSRLAEDDVRGAVDFVGYTRDIAPYLASAGFVLSTSRREGFATALVEGAASGAVPVVRDWPIYAPLGAARVLFPSEWVVTSVEEAAARILQLADEPAWLEASAGVRRAVEERFSVDTSRTRFQELIVGSARA